MGGPNKKESCPGAQVRDWGSQELRAQAKDLCLCQGVLCKLARLT